MSEPTRDELLAALLELVLDVQVSGYFAHQIASIPGHDWRQEWKKENRDWYDLYDRNRNLLERAGVNVPDPTPERRTRRAEVACEECGRKRGHLATCSKHRFAQILE